MPSVLLLTGYVGLAMLLFILLLIGACLVSMYQQQTRDMRKTADKHIAGYPAGAATDYASA